MIFFEIAKKSKWEPAELVCEKETIHMCANTASTKVSNGFPFLPIATHDYNCFKKIQLTAMSIRFTKIQLAVKGHALK
jgi:hypothetical protein